MKEKNILQIASELVNGSRQQDYSDPVVNFTLIGKLATLMTGKELSAKDCCMVLIAVKLARETYKPKEDNRIDMAGYIEILDRIEKGNMGTERQFKDDCRYYKKNGTYFCKMNKSTCINCDEFVLANSR